MAAERGPCIPIGFPRLFSIPNPARPKKRGIKVDRRTLKSARRQAGEMNRIGDIEFYRCGSFHSSASFSSSFRRNFPGKELTCLDLQETVTERNFQHGYRRKHRTLCLNAFEY